MLQTEEQHHLAADQDPPARECGLQAIKEDPKVLAEPARIHGLPVDDWSWVRHAAPYARRSIAACNTRESSARSSRSTAESTGQASRSPGAKGHGPLTMRTITFGSSESSSGRYPA